MSDEQTRQKEAIRIKQIEAHEKANPWLGDMFNATEAQITIREWRATAESLAMWSAREMSHYPGARKDQVRFDALSEKLSRILEETSR